MGMISESLFVARVDQIKRPYRKSIVRGANSYILMYLFCLSKSMSSLYIHILHSNPACIIRAVRAHAVSSDNIDTPG